MLITIDATALLLRSAGVKNYTYYWLRSLRQLAGDKAIRTFPVHLRLESLDHERSVAGWARTIAGIARLHAVNIFGLAGPDWSRPRPDVFHISHLLRRPPRSCKLTATLYDLTCWLMPEVHTRANVASARLFAERVLPLAAGIIAISENTRSDAVRLLKLPEEKIQVIYPGVSEEFFQVSWEAAQQVRERYALERPYVLFVGTIEPRKNLSTLLEAWQALPAEWRREYELVLAGPLGWDDVSVLKRLRSTGLGARYLGYVPEADLPALTACATAFVYPSLYEGFGLPVAQAMAAGVPVITSAVSSLPEVTGDAALLVDPRSVSELRDALKRLLECESLRAQLSARAAARARMFRWDRCARESLRFFARVAGAR